MKTKKKRALAEKAAEQAQVSKHLKKTGEEGRATMSTDEGDWAQSDNTETLINDAKNDYLEKGGTEKGWETELRFQQGILPGVNGDGKAAEVHKSRSKKKPDNEGKWIEAFKADTDRKYVFKEKQLENYGVEEDAS